MSPSPSSPDAAAHPSFTRVELTGPPEAVARLMAALAGVGEVIFDTRSAPDARGNVSGLAEVVTHPPPRARARPGAGRRGR